LGFKLLFLPLQLIWRFGRTLAGQIGPAALVLLLIWTVALRTCAVRVSVGLVRALRQALLVNAPQQVRKSKIMKENYGFDPKRLFLFISYRHK
jgi:hypothetical protein